MNYEHPIGNELIIPFQHCLTPSELEDIRANSNTVTYQKKELIFRQYIRTSHIMFVRSGLVKVFREGKNRRSSSVKIASPGEFLGILSVYGSQVHQFSASAIQSCDIGFIDIHTFNSILKLNGEFAMCLIQNLAKEGLFIMDKLLGQSQKQLPGRIADVILYFSETLYKSEEFDLPLTRRELAELAGTTKESFIRTLAEFKNDKIIGLEGTHVKINSMKIVRTLSELG
jgi:CRP/FNR family transcriptional regulator, polysaccharide utilization system transcription regulator